MWHVASAGVGTKGLPWRHLSRDRVHAVGRSLSQRPSVKKSGPFCSVNGTCSAAKQATDLHTRQLTVTRALNAQLLAHALYALQAEMAILDEIDSGLDIDALRDVASAVNGLKTPERSVLMVTHYRVSAQ